MKTLQKANDTLSRLALTSNPFGEEGLKAIVEYLSIQRNRSTEGGGLDELHLSHCHIGNDGMKWIADSLGVNKKLRVLGLEGSTGIDDVGLAYTADALCDNYTLQFMEMSNPDVPGCMTPTTHTIMVRVRHNHVLEMLSAPNADALIPFLVPSLGIEGIYLLLRSRPDLGSVSTKMFQEDVLTGAEAEEHEHPPPKKRCRTF